VYEGSATTPDAKELEFFRLKMLASDKGYDLYWVVKEYKKLFYELPLAGWFDIDERYEYFKKLLSIQRANGYKDGFAKARYKATLGTWPSGSWQ
jgi:hypothetical protein